MNYREKLVARLLLAVAMMLARDEDHELRNELRAIRRQVEQGGELELTFGLGKPPLEAVPGGDE